MRNIEFDKTACEWAYYGKLHSKFKLNLRHLFCNLDFAGLVDDAPLLEAVAFLQELLRQGKSPRQVKHADFPTGIFAKGVQRYMYIAAKKRKETAGAGSRGRTAPGFGGQLGGIGRSVWVAISGHVSYPASFALANRPSRKPPEVFRKPRVGVNTCFSSVTPPTQDTKRAAWRGKTDTMALRRNT